MAYVNPGTTKYNTNDIVTLSDGRYGVVSTASSDEYGYIAYEIYDFNGNVVRGTKLSSAYNNILSNGEVVPIAAKYASINDFK